MAIRAERSDSVTLGWARFRARRIRTHMIFFESTVTQLIIATRCGNIIQTRCFVDNYSLLALVVRLTVEAPGEQRDIQNLRAFGERLSLLRPRKGLNQEEVGRSVRTANM